MKTKLTVKLLPQTSQTTDLGFTLIEILVVMMIASLLFTIALPSFLGIAKKSKQSEAKQNVSAMNRSQQAYYLENDSFATQLSDLSVGISSQTQNYTYTIFPSGVNAVVNGGVSTKGALKHYGGIVSHSPMNGSGDYTTISVLCQSKFDGGNSTIPTPVTIPATSQPDCSFLSTATGSSYLSVN